jgi:mannose-6-phosphate isomerase-like protein (cupin superfamily)
MKIAMFILLITNSSYGDSNINYFPSGVEVIRVENTTTFNAAGLNGDKQVTGYSPQNKGVGVNKMIVRGRSPLNPDHFSYETALLLVLHVTKGPGLVYIDDNPAIEVKKFDVIIIPQKTRFAVESISGSFEYLTFTSPKWYPEQAFVVDSELSIVKGE